ncbi:MAG TPA: ACT domain-containing protein [Thermoanaerobaculia bacterium]|nr:ACT domain-containing protein [Thermoanaerobaculia bacterium]
MSEVVIPESTQQVIADSTFRFVGTYRFVSARSVANPEKHLMITRDEYELTVVTKEEHLGDVDVLDINAERWLLLAIDCANPFYCVGFIARISAVLSGAGMDILVVSTFSCDWVFVKEDDGPRAADLLRAEGFRG